MDLLYELTYKECNHVLRILKEDQSITTRRIWTLLYPIYRVQVQTYERRNDQLDDLEVFLEHAISRAGLCTAEELQQFFQLTPELTKHIIQVLTTSNHIEHHHNSIRLTQIGWDSLRDGRRYEQRMGEQILFFDGFTCLPLPKAVYHARWTPPGALDVNRYNQNHQVQMLFSFDPWHDTELNTLAQRPDKHAYNIPDEVQDLKQQWVQRAYLPMHIAEGLTNEGQPEARVYLIDTKAYKHNQPFFVTLFRDHPWIMEPLYTKALPDTKEVKNRLLKKKIGMPDDIVINSRGLWRAHFSDSWYYQNTSHTVSQLIRLGNYEEAHTVCVQIWSANPTLRNAAAALKVAARLNKSPNRSEQDIINMAHKTATHLEVPIPTLADILKSATQYQQMEAQKLLQEYVDSVDT